MSTKHPTPLPDPAMSEPAILAKLREVMRMSSRRAHRHRQTGRVARG